MCSGGVYAWVDGSSVNHGGICSGGVYAWVDGSSVNHGAYAVEVFMRGWVGHQLIMGAYAWRYLCVGGWVIG